MHKRICESNENESCNFIQTLLLKKTWKRRRKRLDTLWVLGLVCLFFSGCGVNGNELLNEKPVSNRQKEEVTAMDATTQGNEKGDKALDKASNKDTNENKKESKADSKLKDHIDQSKDYSNYPTTYNSWWFKRNKEHLPSGAQETIDIAKYNAIYVDPQAMAGSNPEKNIYLTFDCGYDNGYTEQMLDILKKHKAPACFFVTQTYIRDSGEIVKRMKEEGHLVGNHTVTHPNLCEASLDKMEEEIGGCQKYMKEATGYSMDPYFRPPKGEYSEYLLQVAKDLGYTTVFWSMAYLDYDVNNQPSVEHVIEHWNQYCHPGAIPLIHNVSSANAGALDQILTNLEQNGYKFKRLDEMGKN